MSADILEKKVGNLLNLQSNEMFGAARQVLDARGEPWRGDSFLRQLFGPVGKIVYAFSDDPEVETEGILWYKPYKGKMSSIMLKKAGDRSLEGERLVIPQLSDPDIIYPAIANCEMDAAPSRYRTYLRDIRPATLQEVINYIPTLNRIRAQFWYGPVSLVV